MTLSHLVRIDRIGGTAIPMRGQDIDTDRIVPARFLRAVTFDGLEGHLFEDERKTALDHPFSNAAYKGASILLVNRNFGCGSSREHAPQALVRWGIKAVVGESFSEIFFGNGVALGLPCVKVSADDVDRLMRMVEDDPKRTFSVNVADLVVSSGRDLSVRAEMPHAAQAAFLEGVWDATALLLEQEDSVRAVARTLPYISGF